MQSPMRVVFHPPSELEFSTLLRSDAKFIGAGLGNIQTARFSLPTRFHQRGGGFFSSLANIAKTAVPFLLRTIAPSAIKFTQDVVHDVSSGERGFKGALKKRGFEALRGVGKKLITGGKRKRITTKTKRKRKRE